MTTTPITDPQNNTSETIIAQCTPHGAGAIALLRLCGPQALSIATKMGRNISLDQVPTHTIHYGTIINQAQEVIDQVMFLVMHAPKTFTGQTTVEITCHNNPWIIKQIIELAMCYGARIANPGEFTQRALHNNKIDLVQAEAINELIHANSFAGLQKSMAQLKGSLSSWVTHLEKELVHALALTEASFEFLDDENITFDAPIKKIVTQAIGTIQEVTKSFDQQQLLRQGVRIALIGSVNAGKSSLFNALLNRNRAIVSNIAGTTRDTLEASVTRNDNTWTIIDTAGLRQTDNSIEQEGIERSRQEAHQADIIVLVIDQSRICTQQEQQIYQEFLEKYAHKCIVVFNKIDLECKADLSWIANYGPIAVSTTTKENISLLESAIDKKIQSLVSHAQSPFLLNQRHFNLLSNLETSLTKIITMFDAQIDYALIAYELKEATAQLAQLTGKTISEDAMNAIFKEFCVGK